MGCRTDAVVPFPTGVNLSKNSGNARKLAVLLFLRDSLAYLSSATHQKNEWRVLKKKKNWVIR